MHRRLVPARDRGAGRVRRAFHRAAAHQEDGGLLPAASDEIAHAASNLPPRAL
jgi:hypothetical protein